MLPSKLSFVALVDSIGALQRVSDPSVKMASSIALNLTNYRVINMKRRTIDTVAIIPKKKWIMEDERSKHLGHMAATTPRIE